MARVVGFGSGRVVPDPSVERLEAYHDVLREIQVVVPQNPTTSALRDLFALIRRRRNRVARILGEIAPQVGRRRSRLRLLVREIEAEWAVIVRSREGLIGCRTAAHVKAAILVIQEDKLNEQAQLESEQATLTELFNHAKMVMDELRSAFDEASRSLTSKQFEFEVETKGQP